MNMILCLMWTTLVVIPNFVVFDKSRLAHHDHDHRFYLRNLFDGGVSEDLERKDRGIYLFDYHCDNS